MSSNIENLEIKIRQVIEKMNSINLKTEELERKNSELTSQLEEKDKIISDLESRCEQVGEQSSKSNSEEKFGEEIKAKLTNALGKLDQIESML